MRRQQVRHPELSSEQVHLDGTYVLIEKTLEQMRAQSNGGAHARAARGVREARARRMGELESLLRGEDPPYFGRLDYEAGVDIEGDGRTHHYIGKHLLEDGSNNTHVISWRSDAAEAFYQATRRDNRGVARKRAFTISARLLTDLADEVLGELPPHLIGAEEWATPQDLLLAELERSRDGQMRDIVATIQADQDELIRAPLDHTLIVQGGPGTGKTAVGLHRASFLLFKYKDSLTDNDVLVVAPNQVFLRYIERILPGLGDTSVHHATIHALGPNLRITREDSPETISVKGDARMAGVLKTYLYSRVKETKEAVRIETLDLELTAEDVNAALASAKKSARTYNKGRDGLRDRLIRLVASNAHDATDIRRRMRASKSFDRLLNRLWPTLSAEQVVADLLTGPRRLASASKDILSKAERQELALPAFERLQDIPWSLHDVPLVDEVRVLLEGSSPGYRHLIVDEAQDLSPMQLRMLGRRSASGSMTILGDLAQATSPWAPSSWSDVITHLGVEDWTVHELRSGYRVPREVMDAANELLEVIGVDVPATESVRETGVPVEIEELDLEDAVAEIVGRTQNTAHHDRQVGVIVPSPVYEKVRAALLDGDVRFGEADRGDLAHRVTLVASDLAKGLEFEHVIMIDGAVPTKGPSADARQRYVSMTRTVHELTLLSVPRPVADGDNNSLITELDTEVFDMQDLDGVVHHVPAIRFQQDGITLYISALPARVLGDVGVVDEWNPAGEEDDPNQGYQRKVMDSHAKKIARFLLDPEHSRLMPTAATLNARRRLNFKPFSVDGEEMTFGILELAAPVYIVDGQHRTAGFKIAAEQDEEVSEFQRPVVIMEGVKRLEEVRQFQTINSTAKRVRTDLADRLLRQLGEFDEPSRSWMAKALDITDILNTTPNGVWRGKVILPNGGRGGLASQRTMTESMKGILHGVLRNTDHTTVAAAVNNFWYALRKLMPEAFDDPRGHVIQKTVGVFAWHEVAADVFMRCYASDKDLSEKKIFDLLRDTGEYVDPAFWAARRQGGIAPNYGGRAGFTSLAQEIIAQLPADGPGGGITL